MNSQLAAELDEGIRQIVLLLDAHQVETFESCQGGAGHCYPEPTVRFFGGRAEGLRALSVALTHGLKVLALRRTWPVLDGEPTGPWWEMTFVLPTMAEVGLLSASAQAGAVIT